MTNIGELRELGAEDLARRLLDLEDQVFRHRIQQSTAQVEAPNKMKQLRRERAQVKTLLRECELVAEGDR